jgi:hypothetical protein
MTGCSASQNTQLISTAGAILRKLTPPRIATLLLVREDIGTQREMADRLNRTPPTISNYLEALEDLPVSLVETEGTNRSTSDGNQVVSAISRCASNYIEVNLQEASWGGDATAQRLDELDACLTPLHTFRTDPPFFMLYAMGNEGSSGWLVDLTVEPVPISNIVTTVKEWLDDSITRKQIRSRLNTFEASNTVEIDERSVILTEKGLEQCRLLDQVMQILAETTETDNDEVGDWSPGLTGDERTVIGSDTDAAAMYCADEGPVLSLPPSITAAELEQLVSRFTQEHADDLVLTLTRSQDETP